MSREQQPEIFDPPREFRVDEDEEVMFVHSLGHIAIWDQVGPAASSSYYVLRYPARATIYVKLAGAEPDAPDFRAIPEGLEGDPEELQQYKRLRLHAGVWVKAIANGNEITSNFLFSGRDKTPYERDEARRQAVAEANKIVRSHVYQDYGLSGPEQLAA